MWLKFFYLLITLCFIHVAVSSQDEITISKPELVLVNNMVNIHYNLSDSKKDEVFKVWIEISDTSGKTIKAKTLTGDLGKEVASGENKLIRWDFENDKYKPQGGIYVQVFAELKAEPEKTTKVTTTETFNRGIILLQSTVFPGWGLTRVNDGKPHWIKGVLGVGCIATAVTFNQLGVNNYNNYLDATTISDANSYFDKSVTQDNVSQAFAYAAIGIWVTDIIWTIAGSTKKKLNRKKHLARGISFDTHYEPLIQTQFWALKLNF